MTTIDPTLELLDPASLLVDLNIREAKLDKEFLASIKDHGVIEPLVAVRTEDGGVRVRHGHRRTLAAIEAAQSTVPVVIVGTEDNDAADRIAKQWHENKHRAGLTNVEEVTAVDQLSLLGLSAATIARRLRTPKKHVENALAVRGSELARAATARYDFLTLEQSATIADFEDDTDAVKALVAAAKQGEVQFQRAAQAATEDRQKAAAVAALLAELAEAGISVVEPRSSLRLDNFLDAEGTPLDASTHAACPGHAAYITEDWQQIATRSEPIDPEGSDEDEDDGWVLVPTAIYVCTDPQAHGHPTRYGSRSVTSGGHAAEPDEAQKLAETEKRRATLANNKAWRAAEPIRRDWLRALAARKTAPKGSAAFLAAALAHDSFTLRKAMEKSVPFACELLGVTSREAIAKAGETATDARAQLVALLVVLAAYEDNTRVDTWRSGCGDDRRYFAWLAANGYPLSDVEALAAKKK